MCRKVVVWLQIKISPSNIFQKMLLLEKYIQNCQACFGLSECEWVNTYIVTYSAVVQSSCVAEHLFLQYFHWPYWLVFGVSPLSKNKVRLVLF